MRMCSYKHGSRREYLPLNALWNFPAPVRIEIPEMYVTNIVRTFKEKKKKKNATNMQRHSKTQRFSREHEYTQTRAVVFFMLPLLSYYVDEWLGFYYDSHTTLCHVPLSYSEWNGEDDRDPASDNCWSSTGHLKWIKILTYKSRFHLSAESNSHLLWLCINTLGDWLKKVTLLSQPIRSKTKFNRDSLTNIFPRFASATRVYFELWLV